MKHSIKQLSAAALALSAVQACAQIYVPDPDLSPFLTTDQARAQLYDSGIQVVAAGRGVGFDAGDYANLFGLANAPSTSRTHFNEFVLRKPIGIGRGLQIGVHAFALNRTSTAPVRVWVSIFAQDPTTPGIVPLGAPVVSDLPLDIPASNPFDVPASTLVYTQRVDMPMAMPTGRYVLAFAPSAAPGAAQPANFALLMTRNASLGVGVVEDRGTFRREYSTFTNNADNGGSVIPPQGGREELSQPIAYRIYSSTKLGDVDGDGRVNIDDFLILAASYETSVGDPLFDPRCDFTNHGRIDLDDFLILAANYEG